MQTSARNQLSGIVSAITPGAVNAELTIALAGGATVIASITQASLAHLNIAIGQSVLAWIKAPQIMVVADFAGYRLSARNQLPAIVAAITHAPVTSEVVMNTVTGEHLVATVTEDSLLSMGLRVGQAVTAVFKAGAVVVAVPV